MEMLIMLDQKYVNYLTRKTIEENYWVFFFDGSSKIGIEIIVILGLKKMTHLSFYCVSCLCLLRKESIKTNGFKVESNFIWISPETTSKSIYCCHQIISYFHYTGSMNLIRNLNSLVEIFRWIDWFCWII